MRHLIGSVILCGLAACSSGSGGAGGGAGGTPPEAILLGQAVEAKIALQTASARVNTASGATNDAEVTDQFWVKAQETSNRVFRYGRPGTGKSASGGIVRHNYRVPITVATVDGVTMNTGTLSVDASSENLPLNVASRVLTFREIEGAASIAGVLQVEQCCVPGEFSDLHAYAGGVAATGLGASATYSGDAVASVIDDTGAISNFTRDATLDVNFAGGTFTGAIGTGATADIALSGAITGMSMTGTAMLGTGAFGLGSGNTGDFVGGVYGAGGEEAAGSFGVSETSGSTSRMLVGAIGVKAD